MGNVKVVCDALRATRSLPAARGLLAHANKMLTEANTKFLPNCEQGFRLGTIRANAYIDSGWVSADVLAGEAAYRAHLQQKMSWLWMNQRVQGCYLDCAGVKDPIALGAWIAATAEIVECSCQIAGTDLMAKMQDAPGVLLFRLAESFVRVSGFRLVASLPALD